MGILVMAAVRGCFVQGKEQKSNMCSRPAKTLRPSYLGPIQIQFKFHLNSQHTPSPRRRGRGAGGLLGETETSLNEL